MEAFVLNLDAAFKPWGSRNEIQYQTFTFAGGEPHIKISTSESIQQVMITHRLNRFNDLGVLCLAVDALKRMGVEKIAIFIPYFPASRQDRVMVAGEPLSVKVYADIINNLKANRVYIFDPHSEVTPALLNNCTVLVNHNYIRTVVSMINTGCKLVAPDGGALKKIYKLSEYLQGADIIECSKSRDVKTGKLSGFKVQGEDLQGADCLVVDDICDGGGTFIGLGEELKKKGAGKLYLAVSHGIFSKGFQQLLDIYERIFTTDSIRELQEDRVTQVKLEDLVKETAAGF
jgi:ribose-phosphate pyrophosphokinase